MSEDQNPEEGKKLRAPTWDQDGVAMNGDGMIMISCKPGDPTAMGWGISRDRLLEVLMNMSKNEQKIRDMELDINSRKPSQFLPQAILELETHANRAEKLAKGDSEANLVMFGMQHAYREAAAILKKFFR